MSTPSDAPQLLRLSGAEPSGSFHHAALKLRRASMQLRELERAWDDYIDRQRPFWWLVQGPGVSEFRLMGGVKDLTPPMFALIIGDVVGNIRSALDILWMGLVRGEHPGSTRRSHFPVADTKDALLRKLDAAPITKAREVVEDILLNKFDEYPAFIKSDNPILRRLVLLRNFDTHNMLVPISILTEIPRLVDDRNNTIANVTVNGESSEIVTFYFSPNITPQDEGSATLIFRIIPEVAGGPVIPSLIAMLDMITALVREFCRRFPHPQNPVWSSGN